MSVYFSQSCPTCGRRIEIRTALLGRIVACQHCGAEFSADPEADVSGRRDDDQDLMLRVERALRRAAHHPATAEVTLSTPGTSLH